MKIVKRFRVHEILFCLEGFTDEEFLERLDLCAKTRARVMVDSEQFAIIPQRLNLENFYGDVPVFAVMNGSPANADPLFKKSLDPMAARYCLSRNVWGRTDGCSRFTSSAQCSWGAMRMSAGKKTFANLSAKPGARGTAPRKSWMKLMLRGLGALFGKRALTSSHNCSTS